MCVCGGERKKKGNIRGLFFPASKCQKKIQLFTFTPEYKIKMWRRLLVLFDISKLIFFFSIAESTFFFFSRKFMDVME